MPPEPAPADAALRDAADALARRVLERLPAAQAHGRAEIAALPQPLARVLLARLDAQVDRAAPPPSSDWLDPDRAREAARAWRAGARQAARVPAPAWVGFLTEACHVALPLVVRPAETLAALAFEDDGPDERPAALLLARISAVSTASFLPEIAGRYVERKGLARLDRPALESLLRRIDRRMAESFTADEWADAVTPLALLTEPGGMPYTLVGALFGAKGRPEMARAFAGRGRLSPAEIRDLLAGLLPAPEPTAPSAADDAEGLGTAADVSEPTGGPAPEDAERLPEAPDHEPRPDVQSGTPEPALDSPALDSPALDSPVLDSPVLDAPVLDAAGHAQADRPSEPAPVPDAPDETPDAPAPDRSTPEHTTPSSQVAERSEPPVDVSPTTAEEELDAWIGPSMPDSSPAAALPPPEADPTPEPTGPPAPADDTPLWQRYAPSAAAAPDAAPALWKRFMPRPAAAPDAHLPSPPVAPPRPPLPPAPPPGVADARPATPEDALSGLDRLERAALGHPADADRRALYITGLFGGSEADYGKTLVALARDASWTEASDTIARDVFRRHRVSPLSDAAVAFVDDVESRFRPT